METSSKKPKQENKKRQKKNFAIKAYNKTKSKIIKKSSKKLNLDKIVTNSKYSEYENLLNQADNLTDSIKRLEKERQLRKLEQIERTAQNIKILKYENKKNNDTSSKIIALLVFILLFAGAVFLTTKNFDNIYQSLFSAKVYTSSTLQGDTKIHFIDVGQGDCVLVEQNNEFCLIDAGPASARQDIVDYLNSQNVDTLKYLILTHPHLDHIGSATEVLENFEVNNVILPDFSSGIVSTSKAYKDVLQTIKNNKIKAQIAKKGDILPLGNGEFEVLLAYAKESENLNDISIVTMFKSEDIKFLSAGDAEDITETELLDSGVDLSADVFKASHHGSYTSNGYKFVEQVNPKICVISCGADNSFGHPHFSTIETLRELKVRYWQTQYAGTVVVCVSNGELVVVPEHEEEYDGIYD